MRPPDEPSPALVPLHRADGQEGTPPWLPAIQSASSTRAGTPCQHITRPNQPPASPTSINPHRLLHLLHHHHSPTPEPIVDYRAAPSSATLLQLHVRRHCPKDTQTESRVPRRPIFSPNHRLRTHRHTYIHTHSHTLTHTHTHSLTHTHTHTYTTHIHTHTHTLAASCATSSALHENPQDLVVFATHKRLPVLPPCERQPGLSCRVVVRFLSSISNNWRQDCL